MALFKNKKISDLPAPPAPDFSISKPDFEDDFPRYTPNMGGFDDIGEKRRFPVMPRTPMEEPEERKTGPIFIKIDKYEQVLDHINSVKDRIKEIEDLIENLKRMKKDEDNALDEWKESLNQIKEKLMIVDKNLFES
ncbi:MAG: hypothetical protein QT11_C0001G0040 [archaeon GW2011_AR20]|nr:MAG: hypothetical protein QT11_C0001G0040 [archaeon GW2011_AR20]MBS3160103.1 hypothetical protein [Candidatus Woesearchaeota archaeon]